MIQSIKNIFPYLLIFIIPTLSFLGLIWQGYSLWMSPLFAFILIPIIDILAKDETIAFNEPTSLTVNLGRLMTLFYVPVQIGLIIFGAYKASISYWTTSEFLVAALAVGLATGGIGITVAHELIHRSEKGLRFAGGILLSSVCYGHFLVEHVHGHHTWVATKKDPATARLNETLYAFYLRTIVGSFKSAWHIENARLQSRKLSIIHHRVILSFIGSLIFGAVLFLGLGKMALVFFLVQSIIAFSLLEIINYIEHYGLMRPQFPDGTYAPMALAFSWDSRRRVSNWFLINLERHSDHHKYPQRDFTRLRFNSDAPLMPAGYPEMLLIALIPPLWFGMMNKRLPKGTWLLVTFWLKGIAAAGVGLCF